MALRPEGRGATLGAARERASARHNPPVLDSDSLLAAARRPLVVGVGGGGDVVGALTVAEPCRRVHGATPSVGGTTWERLAVDPHPGPRRLDEINDPLEVLGPHALLAGPGARARDTDARFAESRMAELLGEPTVLVDPSAGPGATADALAAAVERLGSDLLVLLDVGGDALAHGDEPGLGSPLCDAVVLAAGAELAERGVPVLGAVFGLACDGELALDEILGRVAELAAGGGVAGARWLSAPTAELLERAVAHVPTEASALPLRCFRGEVGVTTIRGGRREVTLSPLGALTIFFDVRVALDTAARLARVVRHAESLEAANDALHALGVRSELDFERAALDR